jgi:hypothetical protein
MVKDRFCAALAVTDQCPLVILRPVDIGAKEELLPFLKGARRNRACASRE